MPPIDQGPHANATKRPRTPCQCHQTRFRSLTELLALRQFGWPIGARRVLSSLPIPRRHSSSVAALSSCQQQHSSLAAVLGPSNWLQLCSPILSSVPAPTDPKSPFSHPRLSLHQTKTNRDNRARWCSSSIVRFACLFHSLSSITASEQAIASSAVVSSAAWRQIGFNATREPGGVFLCAAFHVFSIGVSGHATMTWHQIWARPFADTSWPAAWMLCFQHRFRSAKTRVGPRPTADSTRVSPRPTADSTCVSPRPTADSTRVGPRPTADSTRVGPRPTVDSTRVGSAAAEVVNNKRVSSSEDRLTASDVPSCSARLLGSARVDMVVLARSGRAHLACSAVWPIHKRFLTSIFEFRNSHVRLH